MSKMINRRNSERGQGFVEFAISLVFILLLLAFVLDVGFAFYQMISLRDAAQEAATYGAICPFVSKDDHTANVTNIQIRLRESALAPLNLEDIQLSDIYVEYRNSAGVRLNPQVPVMGGSVVVRVTIHHEILAPFLGTIIGTTTYPLTVQVADTVIRNAWFAQCD